MLLLELSTDTLIADKAYDADERVLQRLERQGKTGVIPPKRNRTHPREYDKHLYLNFPLRKITKLLSRGSCSYFSTPRVI